MNILQRSLRAKSCVFLLLIPFYSFATPAIRFLSLSGCFVLFWALMLESPVCGKLQLTYTQGDVADILTFQCYSGSFLYATSSSH